MGEGKRTALGSCWLEVRLRSVSEAVESQQRFSSRGEVTKAVLEKDDFGNCVEEGMTESGRQEAERAMSMSSAQAGGRRFSAQEGKQRWKDAWSFSSKFWRLSGCGKYRKGSEGKP